MRYNLTCNAIAFIESNVAICRGNARVPKEIREILYLTYNEVFNDSKRPNGCGACQRNVIDGLYKVYLKHKDEIECKKKEKDQETLTGKKADQVQTQTEDQKAPKTKQRKKSGSRTKS